MIIDWINIKNDDALKLIFIKIHTFQWICLVQHRSQCSHPPVASPQTRHLLAPPLQATPPLLRATRLQLVPRIHSEWPNLIPTLLSLTNSCRKLIGNFWTCRLVKFIYFHGFQSCSFVLFMLKWVTHYQALKLTCSHLTFWQEFVLCMFWYFN